MDTETTPKFASYQLGDKTVDVFLDEEAYNPRSPSYDNIATVWCWHKRHELGDRSDDKPNYRHFAGWKELEAEVRRVQDVVAIVPLYLQDHGGLALSTGSFSDRWDSGCVGFAFVTREKLMELGYKIACKGAVKKALAAIESEVETYGQFLAGETFGYSIRMGGGSVWGFYGVDPMKNGILRDALGPGYKQAVEI